MKKLAVALGFFVGLCSFGPVARAACDPQIYHNELRTLDSIWSNSYGRNCIQADAFLQRYAQPITGISSCRVDSYNDARRDFADQIQRQCVNACEAAGQSMGRLFGEDVCGGAEAQVRQEVHCTERVIELCKATLRSYVAQRCPEKLETPVYSENVQNCTRFLQ